MSWAAHLVIPPCDSCGRGESYIGDWNYTHNCNGMIEDALGYKQLEETAETWWARFNSETGMGRHSWWDLLHGKSGAEGAAFLGYILGALKALPHKYRAMNPENGWGDYDSLVRVLEEMRDQSVKYPNATWSACG